MNNYTTILPCPFCGHQAAVMRHWIPNADTPGPCYIQCENGNCGAELDQDDKTPEAAIARWNTRKGDQ